MGRPLIGCNTIDPLLQVTRGEDYDLPTTRRSLEWLKSFGFEAVEFSHPMHWTDEQAAAIRQMTAEIGLVPWSLHSWVGDDLLTDAGVRVTEAYLTRAASVALKLGVGIVVHHTNGTTLAGDGRRRLAIETELLRRCHQPGVRFAVETMYSLAHTEYLVAVVETLGPAIAGINVDTGHANLGDLGAARAIRKAGRHLVTTHLQDNRGRSDDHLPPGDGTIDWDDVAQALADVGYSGCVMLELTDCPSPIRRALGIEKEMPRAAAKARWIAQTLSGQ